MSYFIPLCPNCGRLGRECSSKPQKGARYALHWGVTFWHTMYRCKKCCTRWRVERRSDVWQWNPTVGQAEF